MSTAPSELTDEERASWIGVRVVLWIRENWPLSLSILAGVGSAVVAAPAVLKLFSSGWSWADLDPAEKLVCWILPVVVALIVISTIFSARQKNSKNELQRNIRTTESERDRYQSELESLKLAHQTERTQADQNIQSNLARALEPHLKELLVAMGVWGEQSRVSAYRHDEQSSKFIMISRVSHDPSLAKGGRGIYHDDIGLISTAWTLGECDDDCSRTDPEVWARYQEKNSNLPYDVGISVKMKARSIRGLRLDTGNAPHPLGVLIFEHMDYRRFSDDKPLQTLLTLSDLSEFRCIQTAFHAVPPDTFQSAITTDKNPQADQELAKPSHSEVSPD